MSDPYISQIHMVAFNFPPVGYALCDGQILPISQNQSLYSLLGVAFGGDGISNFALPDMRGRTPTQFTGSQQSRIGGVEAVTLSTDQLPHHTHQLMATTNDAQGTQRAKIFGELLAKGQDATKQYKNSLANPKSMAAGVIQKSGSGAAHNNMQPSLVINFIIALVGVYPTRS